MQHTHYGDEDSEVPDGADQHDEQELFETARFMGWKPEELRDREFAARFAKWLAASPEE